jgi:hypothetical protein
MTWSVTLRLPRFLSLVLVLVLALLITCAFCLITSAGVRRKQETDSATEEDSAFIRGVGRECAWDFLELLRVALTFSYVVKNAPAVCCASVQVLLVLLD